MKAFTIIASFLLLGTLEDAAFGQRVTVSSESKQVAISNAYVRVEFDLTRGTDQVVDQQDRTVCVAQAFWALDAWSSRDADATHQWRTRPSRDELGSGRTLVITSSTAQQPDRILEVTLYEKRDVVAMAAGIDNGTNRVIRLKKIQPLTISIKSCVMSSGTRCGPIWWPELKTGVGQVFGVQCMGKPRTEGGSAGGQCRVRELGWTWSTNLRRKRSWQRSVAASYEASHTEATVG